MGGEVPARAVLFGQVGTEDDSGGRMAGMALLDTSAPTWLRGAPWAAAAATCGVAAGFVATLPPGRLLIPVAFVVALGLELGVLGSTRNAAGLVVRVPVIVFNAVGLVGYVLWDYVAEQARISTALPQSGERLDVGALAFLAAGAALTAGSAVVYAVGPRTTAVRLADAGKIRSRPGPLLLVGAALLAVLIYGKGSAIVWSPVYLAHTGPTWAVSLGGSLGLVGLFAFAYALFNFSPGVRLLAALGLAAWAVVLFSLATRHISLLPGVLVLAHQVSPRSEAQPRRLRWWWVAAAVVTTLSLLHMALMLRSGVTGFGLEPFWDRLREHPGDHLIPDMAAISGNVLYSLPLAGWIIGSVATLPKGSLATSVSPLPGNLTEWGSLYRSLRVSDNTPFNAIGELGAHGWIPLVVFFVAAGVAFAWCDLATRSLPEMMRLAGGLALVGLALLFTLYAMQYNLRSTSRLIYYCVALAVGLRAWAALRRQGSPARATRR